MVTSNDIVLLAEQVPDTDLGPAMRACTSQERVFVCAYVDHPGYGAGAKAARAAAYGNAGSKASTFARVANRLLSRPRIVAAVAEMSRLTIRSDAPAAVKTVREIMSDKKQKGADRLKAARTILERTDPVETTQVHKLEVGPETRAAIAATHEVLERIAQLAARAGIAAETLPPLIDVTPSK